MSRKSGRKPPRSLSGEEAELWNRVTESVEPLRHDTSSAAMTPDASPDIDTSAFEAALQQEAPPAPAPKHRPKSKTRATPAPPAGTPPPVNGLDRRTSQRLTRGKTEIDARLDLHGHTRAEAHVALRGFLHSAHARGHRLVLVITGKGATPYSRHTLHGRDMFHDPERPGILRQAVPGWLDEPDMRQLVAGYQPAHPRHGGGGAFYVRLRRKRTVRQ